MLCGATQMCHSEEFWQNVVHWRRECQSTPVFLSWEPHEQYEKVKRYDTVRWAPRLKCVQYATREEWRAIIPERMRWLGQSGSSAQLGMCLVVTVKSAAVKDNIAEEPGMLAPRIKVNWTRSNGMTRMNIYILGISELKQTGIGEFNLDDHYKYSCGQEFLRRNRISLIVNKRVWNMVFGCNLKNDRMISACFQGKPINITVIRVYAPTTKA